LASDAQIPMQKQKKYEKNNVSPPKVNNPNIMTVMIVKWIKSPIKNSKE
jgi:hypothetical protein